jgi:hypothetical protein
MIRALLLLILVLHALIHLLGFLKAWNLAPVEQLTGKTLFPLSGSAPKAFGLLWLLACLILLAAGVLFLMKNPHWWQPGLAGILLSQFLIIVYWPDAKAGTIANLILLPIVVTAWANWSFDRMAEREAREMFSAVSTENIPVVTTEMIAGLPQPVQQWLSRSGAVGKEMAYSIRLKQQGLLRRSPEDKWMPAKANQYFTTETPGFIWQVDVQMMPLLSFNGRDKYMNGEGNMLIKLLSLVPVVDASGPELDQGTLLRFLGEICWFPSAALHPYITWEPVDSLSAKATMSYKGVTASGVFTFDEEGKMLQFKAQRYMGGGETATLEDWYIPSSEWKVFDGIQAPSKGDVIWKLKDGDFNYYQWEIIDIEYNEPKIY